MSTKQNCMTVQLFTDYILYKDNATQPLHQNWNQTKTEDIWICSQVMFLTAIQGNEPGTSDSSTVYEVSLVTGSILLFAP